LIKESKEQSLKPRYAVVLRRSDSIMPKRYRLWGCNLLKYYQSLSLQLCVRRERGHYTKNADLQTTAHV